MRTYVATCSFTKGLCAPVSTGRPSLPALATVKFKFKWWKVLLVHVGTNQALVTCPSQQSGMKSAYTGLRRCYICPHVISYVRM